MTMSEQDEARAEAQRRWSLWEPTGDPEIDREDYSETDAKWQNAESEMQQAAFVAGANWQAERDANRPGCKCEAMERTNE